MLGKTASSAISRVVSLVLAQIISLSLVACNINKPNNTETTSVDDSGEYVTIIKKGESKYTIIYPENGDDSERKAALKVRKVISEATSAFLSVTDDFINERSGEKPGEFEILIGNCKRDVISEKQALLSENQAYFGERDGTIVVLPYSVNDIGKTVDLFLSRYAGYNPETEQTSEMSEIKIEKGLDEIVDLNGTNPGTDTSTVSGDVVLTLENRGASLSVYGDADALGVAVTDENGVIMFRSLKPIRIYGINSASKATEEDGKYTSAVLNGDGTITASGEVSVSKNVFRVTDVWAKSAQKGFTVDRKVEVVSVSGTSLRGFGSSFRMTDAGSTDRRDDYEYFIPSIIYKDNEFMATEKNQYGERRTLLADLTKSNRNFVKETCVGLPLVMARNVKTGYTVTLQHLNPVLSGAPGLSSTATVINETEQYGSLGYDFDGGLNVEYIYPAQIGPENYSGVSGWINVFHPVKEGASDSYTLAVFAEKTDKFQSAMVNSYKNSYMLEAPEIKRTYDMDEIFALNCELLDGVYTEWGTNEKSGGFPFAISVRDPSLFYVNSNFGMGYIGSQVLCGLFLYRQGLETGNDEYLRKGKLILDFWSSDRIMSYKIPAVEWSPSDNASGGAVANRNSQLRKLVDGFEGMLSAYLYAKSKGQEMTQWYDAVVKFADTLVSIQNSDGSYYRRYSIVGNLSDEDSRCKLNTIFPVRFLCMMYELTGNENYKKAAVSAAEYSYRNIYSTGKYIGGTDDGFNRIDREAGLYAANGFASIYDLTGDARYAEATEHALIYSMSYTFCYDYATPNGGDANSSASNPMKEGGLIGMSVIADCGTNIDTFMSVQYYEMFKEYLRTGENVYLMMAEMLQHNTKLTVDTDGKLGYLYRGMCCEASNVLNFKYYTAEGGVWLPWITATFCKPISEMMTDLGTADVNEAVKSGRDNLLAALSLKRAE
ncbi:MAG: hypothetical protein J5563_08650 [Clostridia bacterium]|nr:hypothetical protein [Clostridia bacterium]